MDLKKNLMRFLLMITIPVAGVIMLFGIITNVKETFADMTYKLITDSDGITWQYGYNPTNKSLEVSFFESSNSLSEIVIPNKTYFIDNDGSISDVDSYIVTNYEDHDLGTPTTFNSNITKIDLSNVDIVNGVEPLLNKEQVTEIILNSEKSQIGYDVFREAKIDIKNLDKVITIGGGAFYKTTFTNTDIDLSGILGQVGAGSFELSNITTLRINAPVIGVSAFKDCKDLTSVEILDDVKQLLNSAFEGDTSLSNFNYNNIVYVGNGAFKNCTSYNIDLSEKLEFIGPEAYRGTTSFNKSIKIPDKVTILLYATFADSSIVGVDLNNVYYVATQVFENNKISELNLSNVERIDYGAFANNLISDLYLPKSIIVMSTSSIWYNNPIEKITIAYDTLSSEVNSLWVLLDGYGKYYDSTLSGSRMLQTIELVAPYGEDEEAKIEGKYDVTREYSFLSYRYSQLTSLGNEILTKELEEGRKYKNVIQTGYLNNLPTIDTIIIGEGYEYLGACQFSRWNQDYNYITYKMGAPKNIILPSTLKGIGIDAFYLTYSNNVFSSVDYSPNINLPDSLEYIGANAFLLSEMFNNYINLPNLEYMGKGAFLYSGITGIVFNDKLKYIGHTPAMMYGGNKTLKELIIDCDFFNIYDDGGKPLEFGSIFYATSSPEYDLIKLTNNVHDFNLTGNLFMYLKAKVLDMEDADLSSIGERTFFYANVGELKLPNKLKKVENGGFWYLTTNTIDLSNTEVEEIGSLVFLSSNIKKIILPEHLKKINELAFYHYGMTLDQEINLPDSIEEIDDKAFLNFKNLPNTISLPNLKTIGEYAFLGTNMENLVLHDKLTSIGQGAFFDNNNLKNITIDCDFYGISNIETNYKSFGQNFSNYFYRYNYNLLSYDTIEFTSKAVTPPTTMYGAFTDLTAKKLDLENMGLTQFDNYMFRNSSFETLLLPTSDVIAVGNWAFYKTKVDNPILLSDSITSIGQNAFQGANLVISNGLPSSLETIGYAAFYDSYINDNIVVPATVTYMEPSIFQSHTKNGTNSYTPTNGDIHRNSITFENPLTVSNTSGQTISQLLWHSSFDEIKFGDNVTELPTNTMNAESTIDASTSEFWNTNVKKVTFGNLKELPKKAFIHNESIEEIDLSEDPNLESIEGYAFFATPNLNKVNLYYGSDISVGGHAFHGSGLTDISGENSGLDIKNNKITLDGEFTFAFMPKLKNIDVTSSLNEGVIPKGTFYSDPLLETVILEDDIKELKEEAFAIDNGLKTFVMYGDTKINDKGESHDLEAYVNGNLTFYLDTDKDFTILFEDKNIEITPSNFSGSGNVTGISTRAIKLGTGDKTYTINNAGVGTFTFKTDDDIYLESVNGNEIHIKDIEGEFATIDTHANLYCYLVNPDCNQYAEDNRELKEENNSDLYYLDEVLYLGANKNYIKLNEDKTEPLTDDLILYALRRDGILMVSDIYGQMTDNVKYVDSGITIKDYDASTTDPRKMVFNTSVDPRYIDSNSNDNFENIEFEIGEEDPETGRANVDFIYTNIITNLQVDTVLKTKGNYVDIIYADGCGGESFANVVYEDVEKGGTTPIFTGPTPEREGYRFIGWDKDISPTADDDVTYTAVWEIINVDHPEINKDPNPVVPGNNGLNVPDTAKEFNIFIPIILIILLLGGIYIIKRKSTN